ncbi:MAG TPA: VWA domain-containing protein [Pyrinomonadaceae bacterium]|nr:VWA domain-containing protein [Pyrinomonadaceae bacterium]
MVCRKSSFQFLRLTLTCILVALLSAAVLQFDPPAVGAQRVSKSSQRPAARKTPAPKPSPTPFRIVTGMGEPPPPPIYKPKKVQELEPGDVVSIETTEVMTPVTVRDSSGRLVSELTRNDFRVFEDEREQSLSDLALRQVPVDVVLMVDASSSVAKNLDDFRRAAEGFAASLAAEDRISLIKFDDRVELLQDWTRSRFQLHRALGRLEPGMFTRFHDALILASREHFGQTKSRRAVIVLTDGIDSGRSNTTLRLALETLLKAQVTVYVISNTEISRAAKKAELDELMSSGSASVHFNQLRIDDLQRGLQILDFSETNLAELTAATGGRLYKPHSFDALDSTYAEVADELRHQYALYYTPLDKKRDGRFRRVEVETKNPDYKATTRIGYFAPRS